MTNHFHRAAVVLLTSLLALPTLAAKTKYTTHVDGQCEMCKTHIEAAAQSIDGVKSAVWDQKTRILTVTFEGDKSIVTLIQDAVLAAGYDIADRHASNAAYLKLPKCCQYRTEAAAMSFDVSAEEAAHRASTVALGSYLVRQRQRPLAIPDADQGPLEVEVKVVPQATTRASVIQLTGPAQQPSAIEANEPDQTLTVRIDYQTGKVSVSCAGSTSSSDLPTYAGQSANDTWLLRLLLYPGRAIVKTADDAMTLETSVRQVPKARVIVLQTEGGETTFEQLTAYKRK